jgi:hypothetical protein
MNSKTPVGSKQWEVFYDNDGEGKIAELFQTSQPNFQQQILKQTVEPSC